MWPLKAQDGLRRSDIHFKIHNPRGFGVAHLVHRVVLHPEAAILPQVELERVGKLKGLPCKCSPRLPQPGRCVRPLQCKHGSLADEPAVRPAVNRGVAKNRLGAGWSAVRMDDELLHAECVVFEDIRPGLEQHGSLGKFCRLGLEHSRRVPFGRRTQQQIHWVSQGCEHPPLGIGMNSVGWRGEFWKLSRRIRPCPPGECHKSRKHP